MKTNAIKQLSFQNYAIKKSIYIGDTEWKQLVQIFKAINDSDLKYSLEKIGISGTFSNYSVNFPMILQAIAKESGSEENLIVGEDWGPSKY